MNYKTRGEKEETLLEARIATKLELRKQNLKTELQKRRQKLNQEL
eukprot:CAMPEP_0170530312 /NCGR_PEP_ID=MMETSP0209-20121228/44884_1 /TAXON_ID=665100 ORGANISM="Litonotus pictus, Strain P1" /NCGR_SAMPLE_ID=MMETSP0209 /ASSEMBLY_ACC=CAM_ASM_000301 /LENGTH=44 /DNA_ID= /DNA_START= /DNA_END= /DNA_ORIENTATION=